MRLTLPYPPSTNRLWRYVGGRPIKSREARDYASHAAAVALGMGAKPLAGDVEARFVFFRPRRRGDLDNALKAVLDALRGIAYADDDQVVRIEATRDDDKDRPRVEVEITERPATPARSERD